MENQDPVSDDERVNSFYESTPPNDFFVDLLKRQGYSEEDFRRADLSAVCFRPHSSDLKSYQMDLLKTVRSSNLIKLKEMAKAGSSMTACNQFGESVFHLACRNSTTDVVHFILENAAVDRLWMVDDKGRCALHDAFWRKIPDFEVVDMLLSKFRDLIWLKDSRGSRPLQYTQPHHWYEWNKFLETAVCKYWPPKNVMSGVLPAAKASCPSPSFDTCLPREASTMSLGDLAPEPATDTERADSGSDKSMQSPLDSSLSFSCGDEMGMRVGMCDMSSERHPLGEPSA